MENTHGHTALRRLAQWHGIQRVFTDEGGNRRVVSDEILKKILGLLDIPATTPQEIQAALRETQDHHWTQLAEDTLVIPTSQLEKGWTLRLPLGPIPHSKLRVHWEIQKESGQKHSSHILAGSRLDLQATKQLNGLRYVRFGLPFPKRLKSGYFTLRFHASTPQQSWKGSTKLIVTPQTCFSPSPRSRSRRLWGITLQLYGLRSTKNWGMGDFQDLKDFMTWAGQELGAAMVGVNPLHALVPGQMSPYSPSSRLFHNPLYLHIETIPDFQENPTLQRMVNRESFQKKLVTLRNSATVRYEGVSSLKWPIFEKLYQHFQRHHLKPGTRRGQAFLAFIQKKGQDLERFAQFQVLSETFQLQGQKAKPWRLWPLEFRHPDNPEVHSFCHKKIHRINLFRYLEWQCDIQLSAIQRTAKRLGMPIGLYQDLAVGLDPNGSDAWTYQNQLVPGISIGTPPEIFSPKGQRWDLVPLSPEHLRKAGYQVFVKTFREMMNHAGLLRIDHAMGLFRLFWIPEGCPPSQGAYIQYPGQDLLGILAIESQKQQVIIVGEDLGTVTPKIRRSLMDAGLLSYRLLLFERTIKGHFRLPHQYVPQAMVAITTHDLPTLAGFWAGRDIHWKERLGLYLDSTSSQKDWKMRQEALQALMMTLKRAGSLPRGFSINASSDPHLTPELRVAIMTFLARTPSFLLAISLEDLLGDLESPNIPGASPTKYPVWRTKAGPPASTLQTWRNVQDLKFLTQALNKERGFARRRKNP